MTHQLELSTLERRWIDSSMTRVLQVMRGKDFTADDLHTVLPAPEQDNWYGALMAKLRNSKRITEVGRVKSTRKERNGAKVTVWRLV